MYSCCQFEDETVPGGRKNSLPQYHTMTNMPTAPQQHLVTATINNTTAIAMVQQQQQQKHQQQQQQGQTYTTMLPGAAQTTGHSAMVLGPSNSPLLEGPMPCSTFLPRHDRRLAVVDRWNRPKPEKVMSVGNSGAVGVGGITGGISELQAQQQYHQNLGQHWNLQGGVTSGGGDTGLEYKRYYGPIDPEGLVANSDQAAGPQQTPKANPRGTKTPGTHLLPKGPQQGPLVLSKPPPPIPSFPTRPPFWRRGSLVQARRKGSGGPLYENVLPLGRRGGGRYGASDGVGRRGRLPPPPPPLPGPLSSPTHTPTTPSSPCHFYSSCSSASSSSSSSTSSSSSSSSSASLSRSNSPSSCSSDSSYNSSLSFRYRAGDRDIMVAEDYDSDLLTEESSLLLGSRRKIRSRRMSSRSLPCSPPPPPIPPRKPRPQRGYGRERTGSQLAQLQEWWASWGDRERERGETSRGDGEGSREEKRHNKERERERKRRKKGRKKKKREERERERERKHRKTKKKRKKEEKIRKRERKRSDQVGGDADKREELKSATSDYLPYPPLRRESFRKKSESSVRSYGWNIPGDDERRERDMKERDDGEDSRGKERQYRRRNSKHYQSSSSKPPSSVKFWGGGNPTSDTIPSAFLPLLPVSSKRRKSKSSDKDAVRMEGERRPLLGRNGRGQMHSKEGLSFHEWESELEPEVDSELERRKVESEKRCGGGRTVSDEDQECDKIVGIYSDDDGSSGEFGKFERYWEDHEGQGVGGIGGGGWFFSTYPSRDKIGSINSRDDLFLERGERWGTAESGWGSSGGGGGGGGRGERVWGSGSHWPPLPITPPPPRRYWSVDKLHLQDEKKSKRKSKDKGNGHTACSSCHSPKHHPHSHSSKWARISSRSQEALYQHCQSFGGHLKPKNDSSSSSKPDRSQNPSKSGSQSNLSIQQRTQRTDRDRAHQSSPPPTLIPNLPPPLPALPAPPPSSHPIHLPPPTSSSSVSSTSVVSSTPGVPQPSSMASASAKLQYQRLRSVPQPQRFHHSPHLPLKAKSLCSRRGSAHFSSVESEV